MAEQGWEIHSALAGISYRLLMIPEPLYRTILRSVPIVCVDLVVRRPDGRCLLVRRRNEPLRSEWWVIGGRVQHGEKAEAAALRKLREEAKLEPASKLRFLGVYEDLFDRNSFEKGPYHTISLVYEVEVDPYDVTLDEQSDGFKWSDTLPERFVIQSSHKSA